VSKSTNQPVPLETTEEQKFRLQLAQRNYDLNLLRRFTMESEIGFYKAQKQLRVST
jgi:hypothetical protein